MHIFVEAPAASITVRIYHQDFCRRLVHDSSHHAVVEQSRAPKIRAQDVMHQLRSQVGAEIAAYAKDVQQDLHVVCH